MENPGGRYIRMPDGTRVPEAEYKPEPKAKPKTKSTEEAVDDAVQEENAAG